MRRLLAVLVAMTGVACSGPNMTTWCVETEAGETEFISKRVTMHRLGTKNDRRSHVVGHNKLNGGERRAAVYFDEYAVIRSGECTTEDLLEGGE